MYVCRMSLLSAGVFETVQETIRGGLDVTLIATLVGDALYYHNNFPFSSPMSIVCFST